MRRTAAIGAALVLSGAHLSSPAAAQSQAGELLGRIASIQSSEGKNSARFLDAGIFKVLRWKQTRMPGLTGEEGGRSEFELVATPIASLVEREASGGPGAERSSLRVLPVLGIRLFESERSTLPDGVSGEPVESHRWSFLKLPLLGPLLGAEMRGGKTRWSFFFVETD